MSLYIFNENKTGWLCLRDAFLRSPSFIFTRNFSGHNLRLVPKISGCDLDYVSWHGPAYTGPPFWHHSIWCFSVPVHQMISHVIVGGKHSIRGGNGAFDVVVSLIRPRNHMPTTGTCGRTEHLPFTFWHVSYRDFVPNIGFRIQASMLFLTFAPTGISNRIR